MGRSWRRVNHRCRYTNKILKQHNQNQKHTILKRLSMKWVFDLQIMTCSIRGFSFLVLLKKVGSNSQWIPARWRSAPQCNKPLGVPVRPSYDSSIVLCNPANCRPRDRPGGSGPSLASRFARCHCRRQPWSYCGSYWGVRGSRQPTTLRGGTRESAQHFNS